MFCLQMIYISTNLYFFSSLFYSSFLSKEYLDIHMRVQMMILYIFTPPRRRNSISISSSVDSNQGRKQGYGLLPIGWDEPCGLN